MIFKTCPYCGANLDPEEICDCQGNGDYMDNMRDQFINDTYNALIDTFKRNSKKKRISDIGNKLKNVANDIQEVGEGGYKYNDGSMKDIYIIDHSEDVVNEIVNDKELMDYIKEHRK